MLGSNTGTGSRLLLSAFLIIFCIHPAVGDPITVDFSSGQIQVNLGTSDSNGASANTTGIAGQVQIFGTGFSGVQYNSYSSLIFNYQGDNQAVVLSQNTAPFGADSTSPIVVQGSKKGALMDDNTTSGGNSFDYSALTGTGTLVNYGSAADSVAVTKGANVNVTLSDSSISSSDGMDLTMTNVGTVSLTMNAISGPGSVDLDNWSGAKTLNFTNAQSSAIVIAGISAITASADSTFINYGEIDANSTSNSGVYFENFATLTNDGNIYAGTNYTFQQSNGTGVAFSNGGTLLNTKEDHSIIMGSTGLSGSNPTNGSAGVLLAAGECTVVNSYLIMGGSGGEGEGATSGYGGDGIYALTGCTIINNAKGFIIGGNSGDSNPANEGDAIQVVEGICHLTNAGVLRGKVVLADAANTVTLFTGSNIDNDLDMSNNAGAILTLDGTGTQTYSAAVNGVTTFSGTLIKQGSGSWAIDRALNSRGGTTITAGLLTVTGSGSIGGPTTVGSGATLGGGGTINGNVTVQSGGKLYPGDPAIMTVNGSVMLNSGATSSFSIANSATPNPPNRVTAGIDFDQVSIRDTGSASNLTIQSGVTLEVVNLSSLQLNSVAYVPTGPNTSLTNYFVYALQAGTVSGLFDFLSDGTTSTSISYTDGVGEATLDGIQIFISYTGNASTNWTTGGHDIVLSAYAVPEPSTWALLGLSLAALGFFQRRIFRKSILTIDPTIRLE